MQIQLNQLPLQNLSMHYVMDFDPFVDHPESMMSFRYLLNDASPVFLILSYALIPFVLSVNYSYFNNLSLQLE